MTVHQVCAAALVKTRDSENSKFFRDFALKRR